eukprot:gnl/Chilomastix_cuspidata/1485.p1 GENE.gnl/Chilomastix_cuspidata/1485~~gnl/Chilomastix_cuspidata/1485.p1  ORF type:complete len:387 (-),score=136.51 gnl/Chilomastix_cuspidata/1485:29-1189(-)
MSSRFARETVIPADYFLSSWRYKVPLELVLYHLFFALQKRSDGPMFTQAIMAKEIHNFIVIRHKCEVCEDFEKEFMTPVKNFRKKHPDLRFEASSGELGTQLFTLDPQSFFALFFALWSTARRSFNEGGILVTVPRRVQQGSSADSDTNHILFHAAMRFLMDQRGAEVPETEIVSFLLRRHFSEPSLMPRPWNMPYPFNDIISILWNKKKHIRTITMVDAPISHFQYRPTWMVYTRPDVLRLIERTPDGLPGAELIDNGLTDDLVELVHSGKIWEQRARAMRGKDDPISGATYFFAEPMLPGAEEHAEELRDLWKKVIRDRPPLAQRRMILADSYHIRFKVEAEADQQEQPRRKGGRTNRRIGAIKQTCNEHLSWVGEKIAEMRRE